MNTVSESRNKTLKLKPTAVEFLIVSLALGSVAKTRGIEWSGLSTTGPELSKQQFA